MAKTACIVWFLQLFREHTGISPNEWLIRHRIESDASEIAEALVRRTAGRKIAA